MGHPETEKLSQSKGHDQQDKMTTCRMGKDFHQSHIEQRSNLKNIQRTQEINHQKNK